MASRKTMMSSSTITDIPTMPTAAPDFQLDVKIDSHVDFALSSVISRVHASNGRVLSLESFSDDATILHVTVSCINYVPLVSMLSKLARIKEKLLPEHGPDCSGARGDLEGRLVVSLPRAAGAGGKQVW